MAIAIITGSAGLIGSEASKFFHEKGYEVYGIDNNLRKNFFGNDGSIDWNKRQLESSLKNYTHLNIDIRDMESVNKLFCDLGGGIKVVIHTAAQPSHDWAAQEPITDFSVNAVGTLYLLEAARKYCPDAPFIFTSTNKVYGDTPNHLPLVELENRWECDSSHEFFRHGIDESMSIDNSKHSVFGASKAAADIMVQEYGRYFDMYTGIFRGGCLTGPAHSGAVLHGFLSYLVKCAVTNRKYTIFGYKGKQVRDNIHSHDLIKAFWQFTKNPRRAAVYNIGGSRHSNGSVLEAITLIEKSLGKKIDYELSDQARAGDHIWWISDVRKFQKDYPEWQFEYTIERIVQELIDATLERTSK